MHVREGFWVIVRLHFFCLHSINNLQNCTAQYSYMYLIIKGNSALIQNEINNKIYHQEIGKSIHVY